MSEWKEIVVYDNYFASKNGNVFSTKGRTTRKLKQYINRRNGYCYVVLSKNNTQKNVRVHRVIARAFIANPKNKCDVNHIDGDKTNNHISNLEWCTRKENILHSFQLGFSKLPPYRGKKIIQMDFEGNYVREYKSQLQAEKITGIRNGRISLACTGKIKTAGGFKWKRI